MTKKKKKKKTIMSQIPENVYGRLYKITGNGLAAGCQLFYCKIYGYFLQCNAVDSSNDSFPIRKSYLF